MCKLRYIAPKERGFTIIEIMVVVVIITVMVMSILGLTINLLNSYYTFAALNDLNNNASFAADELINDLRQADIDMITYLTVLDPATGENHDILVFPMTNGPDISGNTDWQGAIAYYPFTTVDGINQLRKYVHPDLFLSSADFPLTVSITAASINLSKQDGSVLVSFNRASGAQRVLANSISTEDANNNGALDANEDDAEVSLPMDNADGILDTGIDYTITGTNNIVSFKIFLQKPVTGIAGISARSVSFTLNSAATLRN